MSRPRPSGSLSGHEVKLEIRYDFIGYLKLISAIKSSVYQNLLNKTSLLDFVRSFAYRRGLACSPLLTDVHPWKIFVRNLKGSKYLREIHVNSNTIFKSITQHIRCKNVNRFTQLKDGGGNFLKSVMGCRVAIRGRECSEICNGLSSCNNGEGIF
jgi:hypothetical protein